MPTLANINGASLVSDFATPLAEGIGDIQDRRRKKAEESDLEALIRGSLGLAPQQQEQLPQGNGLFGKLEQRRDNGFWAENHPRAQQQSQTGQQQSKGILGQLAPGLAKAISGARGNAEQEGQIRQEAESGQTLAAELAALPSHAARVKRLAQKGGEIASGGGDVGRVTSLANLPPEKLDLELMRMQMIGKEAIAQLPQQSRQDGIAALMARNPQLGSNMLARRDREIAEERARRERAAAAAAAARNRAARAAAAAAAPKGAFAKGLAEIASNEAQGHTSPEQAAARRAVLEGKFLSAEVPAFSGKVPDGMMLSDPKNPRAGVIPIPGLSSGGGGFDPESPTGKRIADRMALASAAEGGEPTAVADLARFDAVNQVSDDAANESLTSTELANLKAQRENELVINGDGVQDFAIETTINDDGSAIQATSTGEIVVKNTLGEVVEGQERLDVLTAATAAQGTTARMIAAEKAAGAQAVNASGEAFAKISTVRENIANLNEAISLIQSGAPSGPIQKLLPNVSKGAVSLGNVQNRLGLDIIRATTFGALAKGELDLALDTALPTGLGGEDLEQWVTVRRDAQVKLSGYLTDAATFLGTPGNTVAKWTIQQNDKRRLVTGPMPEDFNPPITGDANSMSREEIWRLATPGQRTQMLRGE